MNQKKPDRVRLYQFYMWLNCPSGLHSLNTVLARQRDEELLFLMQSDNKQAATLAWAEFGRRHGLALLDFHMGEVDVLTVNVHELVVASQVALA